MADRKILAGDYTPQGEGYHEKWLPGDNLVDPDGNPVGGLSPSYGELFRDSPLPLFPIPPTFTPTSAIPFEHVGNRQGVDVLVPTGLFTPSGTEGLYAISFAMTFAVASGAPTGLFEVELFGRLGGIPGAKQLLSFPLTTQPDNLAIVAFHPFGTDDFIDVRVRRPLGVSSIDIFHSTINMHRIGELS